MDSDKKEPGFWQNLVGQKPKVRSVNVGDYQFSQLTPDTPFPEDTAILARIARAVDAVDAALRPNEALSKEISLDSDDPFISIKTSTIGEERVGHLHIGSSTFESDFPDSNLTGVLHHESGHISEDFPTIEAAKLLTGYRPQSSAFIVDCQQNLNEVVQDLIRAYPPGKLLEKLDRYATGLEMRQKSLSTNLEAVSNSPFMGSLIELNGMEPGWNSISTQAVAAIVYDMEGEQKLYREIRESSENSNFYSNYDPFAMFTSKRKETGSKAGDTPDVEQNLVDQIEEKLQRILELDQKNNELATPLFKLGVCIQWANELRCDRVAARHNVDHVNTEPQQGEKNATKIESPFGFIEYLRKIDALDGNFSHPGYLRRVREVADVAITRYAEDFMLSGAPEQDAREMAETRVREEAAAKGIDLPSTLHPVESPETSAARRNYNSHVERLGNNARPNKSPER